MGFLNSYIRQLPRIILHRDGFSNTLSLWKTLWINFKFLNIKDGCKLPIWIYRHTKFHGKGRIILDCEEIRSGMIKIGNIGNASRKQTIFENSGNLIFKDQTTIFRGCYILNRGTIIFEGFNLISEGCTFKILESLKLGKMTIVGSETYIIDTDFHYSIDLCNNKIKRSTKGIEIGECNWLATNTFVKKGVKTGVGLVAAAAYTVLSKDYSDLPDYTVIGGSPAKPISVGLRGIFNEFDHHRLDEYFKLHDKYDYVTLEGDNSLISNEYFKYSEFQ